jgi:photosynthetic reaction center cytochrome c subunit
MAGIALVTVVHTPTLDAQQWTPPAPKNLQVLDKGIGTRELIGTMKGFTRALGVRCQHCHVYRGDNPDDLSAFDFASDEKAEKKTARAMLRMASAINGEYLKGIGEAPVPGQPKVTCYSCHRGEKRPLTEKPAPASAKPGVRD